MVTVSHLCCLPVAPPPADSGLQREWRRVLVRQRLRRLLLSGDLDGPDDQPAHGAAAHLRPPHDPAAAHHGPLWRPQGPCHLCPTDRVMEPTTPNYSCPTLDSVCTTPNVPTRTSPPSLVSWQQVCQWVSITAPQQERHSPWSHPTWCLQSVRLLTWTSSSDESKEGWRETQRAVLHVYFLTFHCFSHSFSLLQT